MKKNLLPLIIILFCQSFTLGQDIEDTLTIYGRDRFYRIHLPLGYNYQNKYPVVFVFHGGLGSPDNVERMAKLTEKADKEGFVVIYPYGTGPFDKKLLTWNTWECCGYAHKKNIDEIEYVKSILMEIKEKFSVDSTMIFATGISNGGMMCYLLACELSNEFAAIAPVVATMFDENQCDSDSELSMVIFNSLDDKHIPYEGGIGEESIVQVDKMPVEKVVDFWTKRFNCSFVNKSEAESYHKITFKNQSETEIVFYRMLSGGHSWPGGEKGRLLADRPVKDVSATDIIWEFFKNHPKH